MITSFIEGRVRIRDKALRDPAAMETVLSLVRAQDGIGEVTPNPRTGSVLVTYDPEKISREMLLQAAALLEAQLAPAREKERAVVKKPRFSLSSLLECVGKGRGKGRLSPFSPVSESALMGGLYLLTAATGFTSRRMHIVLGLGFAAVAGMHLYDRRRCL